MAVADYVLDKEQPPPLLRKALNYKAWGGVDIRRLPAGMLDGMNTALFYYNALQGYQSAFTKTVEWSKRHPQEWEAVTWVIDQRRKRKRGDSTK